MSDLFVVVANVAAVIIVAAIIGLVLVAVVIAVVVLCYYTLITGWNTKAGIQTCGLDVFGLNSSTIRSILNKVSIRCISRSDVKSYQKLGSWVCCLGQNRLDKLNKLG